MASVRPGAADQVEQLDVTRGESPSRRRRPTATQSRSAVGALRCVERPVPLVVVGFGVAVLKSVTRSDGADRPSPGA